MKLKDISKQKKSLITRLASPSDPTRYKRYIGSPLRYAGGKSLAVGYVVSLLPDKLARVVAPFYGGGSVEIAIARELGVKVIGYDIFDILVNYWQHQIKAPGALADRLRRFKPTKAEYNRVREIMKSHWKGIRKLAGVELAATYYFNHNYSYGPHFLGSQSSVYLRADRHEKTIQKVQNFDGKNLEVHAGSFETIIPKYKRDFLYCDPPYYLDGDSKMFVGMYPHRNFPIHHKDFDHAKLRDLLIAHKGGFILCYNDCSTIREWYKDFNMVTPTWQYTFSQGDVRIGKNRKERNGGSHIKKSHEIIIWKMPS